MLTQPTICKAPQCSPRDKHETSTTMKRVENMEAIALTAGNFKASADAERDGIAWHGKRAILIPDEDARQWDA